MTRALLLAALAALAVGCTGTPGAPPEAPAPAPPAEAPAVADPLPVVTVTPGEAATVDLGPYADAVFDPPPGVDVDVADGTASVRVADGFRGLVLVPFESDGERHALAVQRPTGAGSIRLERVGMRASDPTVLDLRITQRDARGAAIEPTVDEDTGVVLLVDDREGSETALDYDVAAGVIGLDLDVAGPGAHRLRVAARAEGLVSNWVEVTVADGRIVE